MKTYSAHDAKQRFGEVLSDARQGPVAICRYRRPVAYVVSAREFRRFADLRDREWRRSASRLVDAMARDRQSGDTFARALIATLARAEDERR